MAEESRVDAHDRNKLDRMLQDLSAETEEHDALHAMFLVTREHEHAHDVFRRFRQVYEDATSPFHSLTIFGQHGVSHAGRLLAEGLGVTDDQIPSLVLFGSHHDATGTLVPLPASEAGGLDADVDSTIERLLAEGCSVKSLYRVTSTQAVASVCQPPKARSTACCATPWSVFRPPFRPGSRTPGKAAFGLASTQK